MNKPPITLDLKVQFFAHYIGQKCVFTGKGRPARQLGAEAVLSTENLYLCCFLPQRALVLNALSGITNNHAAHVSVLSGVRYPLPATHVKHGRAIVDPNNAIDTQLMGWQWLQIHDFLRSKGYALPFLALDVSDLIQLGWIQLQYDPQ